MTCVLLEDGMTVAVHKGPQQVQQHIARLGDQRVDVARVQGAHVAVQDEPHAAQPLHDDVGLHDVSVWVLRRDAGREGV